MIKGPDSSKVVRMAMDLGALAVRGNHDHEAIRDYFTTVLPLKRAYLRYQEVRRKLQLDQGTHRTENRSSDAVDEDNPEKKKNDTPQAPQDPTATRSEASGPESSYIDRIAASLAPRLSTRPHAFLAAALTPKEMAWMCEMPYIIQSGDLRAVFVHAELQRDVPLDDQQPHVNMYMTINKKWAKFWPGPLTAYFGHDTARGLQKHQFSYGLDTGLKSLHCPTSVVLCKLNHVVLCKLNHSPFSFYDSVLVFVRLCVWRPADGSAAAAQGDC